MIPLIALAAGFAWWLTGGRYVTTDNAYVGADKSLITPQVTGAIVGIHVVEGQKVKVGDPLFDIDPEALRDRARARQGPARRGQGRLRQPQVVLREQSGPDQDGRGRGQGPARPTTTARTTWRRAARAPASTATPRSPPSSRPSRSSSSSATSRPPPWSSSAAASTPRSTSSPNTSRRRRGSTTPSETCATPRSLVADRRRGDAGAPDRAWPRRAGGPAGVRGRRRQGPVGRRQSQGIGHDLRPRGPAGERHHRRLPRQGIGKERSARSLRAPARSSRSCRRRTRAATGSRSSSACRCASASAPTRTPRTCAPA